MTWYTEELLLHCYLNCLRPSIAGRLVYLPGPVGLNDVHARADDSSLDVGHTHVCEQTRRLFGAGGN